MDPLQPEEGRPHRRGRRANPQRDEQILQLLESGQPIEQVAEQFYLLKVSVKRAARRAETHRRSLQKQARSIKRP